MFDKQLIFCVLDGFYTGNVAGEYFQWRTLWLKDILLLMKKEINC
jgi:hypothetical protein